MYIEPEKCDCGSKMYRIRAQSGKGDIPLGFYCSECKSFQNTEREYLIPANLITRLDPFFKTVSKREAYLAILETGDRAVSRVVINKMIDNTRDAIGSALAPFCREPGKHETPRLDRVKFKDDLKREVGENCLRDPDARKISKKLHQPS